MVIGASRNDGDFIMGLLNILLYFAFSSNDGKMDRDHKDIITELPSNIRAALSKFDLNAKTTVYAACPKCHYTYAPTFAQGDSAPRYPLYCTNRRRPESDECAEPLLRHDKYNPGSTSKPIKPFVYHSFHDYLAGLLSRKDLEGAMDKCCDDLSKVAHDPPPNIVTDVWEAQFLREFQGPTPGTRFVDRGDEGRYGFTLNVDFFNVEGMRIRGASTSAGLISMACLNLPPEIRYKPENMYVAGIIPPPDQPKDIDLNHYVRPVVDDLADSWTKGVKYSQTALHPLGRTTRSAVIIAAMDLPGARHTSQTASHSAHIYCTVCQCRHRSTLGRVDHEEWCFRDDKELRRQAELWRDADSSKAQDSIFDTHGVRWSELWRLPYWSVTRQLTVDTMHCLLEGLFSTHFRHILGLTAASAALPPLDVPAFSYNFVKIDDTLNPPLGMTEKEVKQVQSIHILLTKAFADEEDDSEVDFESQVENLRKKLMNKNGKPLKFVCDDLGLQPTHNLGGIPQNRKIRKEDVVAELINWVGGRFVLVLHQTDLHLASKQAITIRFATYCQTRNA